MSDNDQNNGNQPPVPNSTKVLPETPEMSPSTVAKKAIELMRPKLLLLSKKNPLISTKFSERTSSLIRVVDELPQNLYEHLTRTSMEIVPLPPMEMEPADEKTQEFFYAYTEALANDPEYAVEVEDIDHDFIHATELLNEAQRRLKDRVRVKLGLPKRSEVQDISLAEHARKHGISASYDLPLPEDRNEDGRHDDEEVQTLLSPEQLERKLSNIISKGNSWADETGVSVFKIVYGFLEWNEAEDDKDILSPLLTQEVKIEKRVTNGGLVFSLRTVDEPCEVNFTLAIKLEREFGIVLPPLERENQDIEAYFAKIAALAPSNIRTWRVRRQVAIGILPSVGLTTYQDIDSTKWKIDDNGLVAKLFGFEQTHEPVAESVAEDTTDPYTASSPLVVCDADASQFKVIQDVIDGKNLAVEGPPGSGKSQTIVNTIAAAMMSGKKVLFVAEKSAALNVVKNRLEALGLGEFILPLIANKSEKESIYKRIKSRVEMERPKSTPKLKHTLEELIKLKNGIDGFAAFMKSEFGNSGLTVHDVFGNHLWTRESLNNVDGQIIESKIPSLKTLNKNNLDEIAQLLATLEKFVMEHKSSQSSWSHLTNTNIDEFTAKSISDELTKITGLLQEIFAAAAGMKYGELKKQFHSSEMEELISQIETLKTKSNDLSVDDIKSLHVKTKKGEFDAFVQLKQDHHENSEMAKKLFTISDVDKVLHSANVIINFLSEYKIAVLNEESIRHAETQFDSKLNVLKAAANVFEQFDSLEVDLRPIRVSNIVRFYELVKHVDPETLMVSFDLPRENIGENRQLIDRALTEATNLIQLKEGLSKVVELVLVPDSNRLREMLGIIVNAGIMAFTQAEYRKAMRDINAFTTVKLSKSEAILVIKRLISYQESLKVFAANEKYKGASGYLYDGLHTPFQRIKVAYEIAERLLGISSAEIKVYSEFAKKSGVQNLLKNFEVFTAEKLMQMGTPLNDIEIMVFVDGINAFKSRLANEILNVHHAALSFRNAKFFDRQALENFQAHAKKCQALEQELQAHAELNRITANLFNNADLNERGLRMAEVHNFLHAQGETRSMTLLNILSDNACDEVSTVLKHIYSKQIHLDKMYKNVANTTGVNFEELAVEASPAQRIEQINAMAADRAGLRLASKIAHQVSQLEALGLKDFANNLIDCKSSGHFSDVFYGVLFRSAVREIYRDSGIQTYKYSGEAIEDLRHRFNQLDSEYVKLSQEYAQHLLYSTSRPPDGNGTGPRGSWTQSHFIQNEINKTRRFSSLRKLTTNAGHALLEYMPCWMMSPSSVAQYLKAGEIEFDLVIIDEASQMTPENSVGSLLRAKQAMIVGDTNQLPPTNFFKKTIDDDPDEESVVSQESILEIANSTFRPARRLRWHYRSKHSGLIAFSNKYVYESDLEIFPSPSEASGEYGVFYKKVDGLYKDGSNPVEAKAILDLIVDEIKKHPNNSIGVVALNQKQAEAIQADFDYLVAHNEFVRSFQEKWDAKDEGLEKFFVKNLENVQGDERDTIIIGTVYGPEVQGGPVAHRFGPINGVSGKRRLNVLFTRAKKRIITVSSMTAEDIHCDDEGRAGLFMLKKWLEYSATGKLETAAHARKEPDSDFERYVIKQIEAMGCEAVPQVGVSGFFVDIGIKHPSWPHGYIMGIECDGASFHSSKSARERDRLRESVLKGLGWNLHRIWSTSWYDSPTREAARLRAAIEARLAQLVKKAG